MAVSASNARTSVLDESAVSSFEGGLGPSQANLTLLQFTAIQLETNADRICIYLRESVQTVCSANRDDNH